MYKKILVSILAIVITFSLIACSKTESLYNNEKEKNLEENAAFPITVTDSYDRQVIIPKEPQKIISIAPNITEIIFALDRSSKLVGRTEYCDYPKEVENITSIGSLKEPNLEKIIELKPDLVIASTHFEKEVVQKLEELGINVVVFYGQESFEGVYDTINKVGLVLNAKENADKVVKDMKAKVQDVLDKVKGQPCPKVYYVVSFGKSGEYTAGKDTFIGQMIEIAGGKNAADDTTGWGYSVEKLMEKNPDIVVCSKYNNAKLGVQNANGYKELDAVKNGKLYEIDNNLLDRQSTRLADGLTELAKIIHTEAYK